MKIEKISENQIRCTLNKADLSERHLKISELAYGSDKAKELFRDMMEQANIDFGFDADNIPLMIEAIPTSKDSIVLLITKVDNPDDMDAKLDRFGLSDLDASLDDGLEEDNEEDSVSPDIIDCFEQLHELMDEAHDKETGEFIPLSEAIQKKKKKSSGKNILSKSERKQFIDFISEFVSETNDYEDKRYEYFGDELYMVPEQMPELKGIKLVRAGLHIATKKKNRFEPAHAFAKYLKPDDVKQYYECSLEEAEKYLHGDVLQTSDESLSTSKGFILVCYNGLSLGWGKITNGTIKNHYPKGLRINY
jgi:NOL1/NOP2/fmu family ribosome biogenesis protein